MKGWQYPPTYKGIPSVVQGQRVAFKRNPITGLLIPEYQQLARAEDPSVAMWDVTLSPIYKAAVGPDGSGLPISGVESDGAPQLRMTWGGGGVSWREEFAPGVYPATGACFSVAGDNVMLEVRPLDVTTVFTAQNVPAVVGWVRPSVAPNPQSMLTRTFMFAAPAGATIGVPPFSRAVVITKSIATTTVTITFSATVLFAPAVIALPGVQQIVSRIPIPEWAQSITVVPSAGTVNCTFEQSFT